MTWTRVVIALAALALATATARLGVWQLDRAAQKSSLQQALDLRRALPPLPPDELARDAKVAALQHHRLATLEGSWLDEHTVYLENRQMRGQPGFFVVTPLRLPDGSAALVQRGWQPRDLMDRTKVAPVPTPSGVVRVEGRIAPPPARLYDLGPEAAGRIRQNLDVESFSRETRLDLRPWSLMQLDGPQGPTDGLLRDWTPPAAGLQKHHGYAFQWFALSALTIALYVWFQLLRPRRRSASRT